MGIILVILYVLSCMFLHNWFKNVDEGKYKLTILYIFLYLCSLYIIFCL